MKVAPGFEFGDLMGQLKQAELGLLPIRVECWNGLVFACLDLDAPSLLDWLGDIKEISTRFPDIGSLEFQEMRENEGPTNWKTYSDNSAEGYHLSSVHPNLDQSLVSEKTDIRSYENGQFVGFDVTYQGPGGDGEGFWIYKFPGLLLHFSQTGFNIERIIPIDATTTKMQRWFWFAVDVTDAERQSTMAFSNEIMDEDLGICLTVQRNLEGGKYHTGFLSSAREPGTIFFQSCLRSALGLDG